jgi:hypothetical protein
LEKNCSFSTEIHTTRNFYITKVKSDINSAGDHPQVSQHGLPMDGVLLVAVGSIPP